MPISLIRSFAMFIILGMNIGHSGAQQVRQLQTDVLVRAGGQNIFVPVSASIGKKTIQACDLRTDTKALAFVQRVLHDHSHYLSLEASLGTKLQKTTFSAGDLNEIVTPTKAAVTDLAKGAKLGAKAFINEVCVERPDGTWRCYRWVCDDT